MADCFAFPSISGRDKTTKPLVKTKAALEGLLNPEQQEDVGGSSTDDYEENADSEPKSQPSDAARLETGKRSGEEATTAQLEKEKHWWMPGRQSTRRRPGLNWRRKSRRSNKQQLSNCSKMKRRRLRRLLSRTPRIRPGLQAFPRGLESKKI